MLANLIWLAVFRREATTREELISQMGVEATLVTAAVESLIRSGRVAEANGRLTSANLVLPVGTLQGWEASVLDHFRAVALAIAQKVRLSAAGDASAGRTGGSTFTFTITDEHPLGERVRSLLQDQRRTLLALWEEVAAYNALHPPRHGHRVSFYFGQLEEELEEPSVEDHEDA